MSVTGTDLSNIIQGNMSQTTTPGGLPPPVGGYGQTSGGFDYGMQPMTAPNPAGMPPAPNATTTDPGALQPVTQPATLPVGQANPPVSPMQAVTQQAAPTPYAATSSNMAQSPGVNYGGNTFFSSQAGPNYGQASGSNQFQQIGGPGSNFGANNFMNSQGQQMYMAKDGTMKIGSGDNNQDAMDPAHIQDLKTYQTPGQGVSYGGNTFFSNQTGANYGQASGPNQFQQVGGTGSGLGLNNFVNSQGQPMYMAKDGTMKAGTGDNNPDAMDPAHIQDLKTYQAPGAGAGTPGSLQPVTTRTQGTGDPHNADTIAGGASQNLVPSVVPKTGLTQQQLGNYTQDQLKASGYVINPDGSIIQNPTKTLDPADPGGHGGPG